MLAEDEISVKVGSDLVFLRPTLRAAMRLHRAHGGFDAIVRAILDDNVTVMASVIREAEEGRSDLPRLIEGLACMPLYLGVEGLKGPLLRLVAQLVGAEETDEADTGNAKPMPFAEWHARLYKLATGWLGWTPEVAWTSTAAEIVEAYKGRVEMLKAIFGSGDAKADEPAEQTPEVFNAKLSAVFAMASARIAAQGAA